MNYRDEREAALFLSFNMVDLPCTKDWEKLRAWRKQEDRLNDFISLVLQIPRKEIPLAFLAIVKNLLVPYFSNLNPMFP